MEDLLLLLDTTEERSIRTFHFDVNDSLVKSLESLEIQPSLACILSEENHAFIPNKPMLFKPSLFSKSLAAQGKMEKHTKARLREVYQKINTHARWYAFRGRYSYQFWDIKGK